MKALITGASSGIGRDMAEILSKAGYELYIVARRTERLNKLAAALPGKATPITADLSKAEECKRLYELLKNEKIDILVNNAGFGLFGKFMELPLERELEMLQTNIVAVHILTKLFLKDFKQRNSGFILNVSSSAGFLIGPLLSSYYASKAYVLRLSQAIAEELRREKSGVSISVLCPGPVKTEFDNVANVSFSLSGLESRYVAEYAIKKMFRRKTIIIPGKSMKFMLAISKITPDRLLSKIMYHMQHLKENRQ